MARNRPSADSADVRSRSPSTEPAAPRSTRVLIPVLALGLVLLGLLLASTGQTVDRFVAGIAWLTALLLLLRLRYTRRLVWTRTGPRARFQRRTPPSRSPLPPIPVHLHQDWLWIRFLGAPAVWDTGAMVSLVSPRNAAGRLLLPWARRPPVRGRPKIIGYGEGPPRPLRGVFLQGATLAGHALPEAFVAVLEDPEVPCLVGLDAFRGRRMLWEPVPSSSDRAEPSTDPCTSHDSRVGTLREVEAPPSWVQGPAHLSLLEGRYVGEAHYGGHRVVVELDTGAARCLVSPRLGLPQIPGRTRGPGHGVLGPTPVRPVASFPPFSIGSATFGGCEPSVEAQAEGLVVGADLVRRRALYLDGIEGQAWFAPDEAFSPPPAPAPRSPDPG